MPGSFARNAIDVAGASPRPLGRSTVPLLPWMELACCAMLAGLLFWKGILPGWHFLNTDFPNYYLVARLLREGYALDRIYDWVWLQRIKDHWGLRQPLVGFAGLTPFSVIPVLPFSFFAALVAKRLWILTNLLLLGASVELLNRVTTLGRRRVWLLSLLAVFPLRTSFLLGQMHLLVLFLFVAAYYFRCRGRRVACAVCLTIAGFLKVYPLLFLFYFAWKRQWRLVTAMLCTMLLLLAISYAWIGSDAIDIYFTQILPRSLQGEVLDPYSPHAASAAALFHRLFIFEPSLNPAPLVRAPWLYAVLYPLWQLIIVLPLLGLLAEKGSRDDAEPVEWAAWLFALLVLSPVPASYHFVVMIFSMILLVDHLWVLRQAYISGVAVGLYCAISVIEFVPFAKKASAGIVPAFGRLWIELLLMALFLFCLWKRQRGCDAPIISPFRAASLCAVGLAVWIAGALGYLHHFQYLREDAAARILPAAPAYLSTGLRLTPEGFLSTSMLFDGYRMLDQSGHAVWSKTPGYPRGDQLSAAITPGTPGALIELAGDTGSSLFAVTLGHSANGEVPQALLANAESPAISAGGTSVAFIREEKGHGALWLARLEQPLGHLRSQPTEVTNRYYDVRDVSFARSGWILFSARVDGHLGIFSLVPGREPRIFLPQGEDVDSPAISADEHFVAFRRLVFGRWQLGYMDVATGHQRMLTWGDCNAYSPAWLAPETIAYATDCGRGLGLSALAAVRIDLGHQAARLKNRVAGFHQ